MLAAAAATLLPTAAMASGRAGSRVEVGLSGQFSIRIYAEEIVYRIGSLEVATGVDYRYPENWVTPYTAVNWYAKSWWASVEAAGDVPVGITPGGFRLAVSFGLFW